MSNLRQAAEQCTHGVTDGNCKECYMADEQEPFAYCYVRKGTSVDILTFDDNPKDAVSGTVFPLYAAPPQRKPLPPQSPCEMTQAERKMFRLGWLECEAAHGIKEKNHG